MAVLAGSCREVQVVGGPCCTGARHGRDVGGLHNPVGIEQLWGVAGVDAGLEGACCTKPVADVGEGNHHVFARTQRVIQAEGHSLTGGCASRNSEKDGFDAVACNRRRNSDIVGDPGIQSGPTAVLVFDHVRFGNGGVAERVRVFEVWTGGHRIEAPVLQLRVRSQRAQNARTEYGQTKDHVE